MVRRGGPIQQPDNVVTSPQLGLDRPLRPSQASAHGMETLRGLGAASFGGTGSTQLYLSKCSLSYTGRLFSRWSEWPLTGATKVLCPCPSQFGEDQDTPFLISVCPGLVMSPLRTCALKP